MIADSATSLEPPNDPHGLLHDVPSRKISKSEHLAGVLGSKIVELQFAERFSRVSDMPQGLILRDSHLKSRIKNFLANADLLTKASEFGLDKDRISSMTGSHDDEK